MRLPALRTRCSKTVMRTTIRLTVFGHVDAPNGWIQRALPGYLPCPIIKAQEIPSRIPLGHVEKRVKPLRDESKKKIAIGASDAACGPRPRV